MKNLIFSLVIVASLSYAFPVEQWYDEPNSVVKIERLVHAGRLHQETALVYKVMAETGRGDLPPELQSSTPVGCGTPVWDELANQWPLVSRSTRQQIRVLMPETSLLDMPVYSRERVLATYTNLYPDLTKKYTSKKGHFILYYSTQGSNAVADLKYVKKMAKAFEKGYKKIKKMYGKTAKNDPVEVFIFDRAYGACHRMGAAGNPPVADSWITMENDLDQRAHAGYGNKYGKHLMQAVPVHEYFHAVQNNYDATEGVFMKESSSSWIEGVIYRGNKLYIVFRVPLVYNTPNWPLWHGNGYQGTLFQRFCQEHFKSISLNKAMWEVCDDVAGKNGVAAIGSVLAAQGSSWDEALKEYGAKNGFYRYWDYKKYKDVWPNVKLSGDHAAYGVEPKNKEKLYEMGAQYIKLTPPAGGGDLKKGYELLVKLKPTTGSAVGTLLMERGKRNYDSFDIPIDATDANGYYELIVGGFGKKYKTAMLVVQNRANTGTDLNEKKYTYAAACPQITLNSWDPSPAEIGPGQSSTLTLKYDVEGCWTSMDYPLRFKAHIRGPGKVRDGVTDLVEQVRNGANKEKKLYFNAGIGSGYSPGTYKVGIQFVFGSTKKLTSKTKILWLEVELKKVENVTAAEDAENVPAALTFGP